MKNILLTLAALAALSVTYSSCSKAKTVHNQADSAQFIRVDSGKFVIADSVLPPYMGVNFWYGPILASEGRGGDRDRLARELDLLQDLGATNLRVLAGADGPEGIPSHVEPALQIRAGVYNDTLLAGLDYFLAELERRGMTAVLYLNNAWEWSGGYGSYLEWAGEGAAPVPAVAGYDTYMNFAGNFLRNDSAQALFANHVRAIVGRTNSVTGRPYAESPAIMSWQIGNEPRAFSEANKTLLLKWLKESSELIKSIDPNHLVSVGSEGSHGCETDINLWADIHALPTIDYGTIHIWPYNWSWARENSLIADVDSAIIKANAYIARHAAIADSLGIPLVLEEFGYPRDEMSLTPGSATEGRDAFYRAMAEQCGADRPLAGVNVWGWGGLATPMHHSWQPGDPYTGDPAQEPQGLNSVFAADSTTLSIMRKTNAVR